MEDHADRLRAKLKRPPLGPDATPAWNVFARMTNPITYNELDAFCRLEDYALNPWEVRAVMALSRRLSVV